MDKLLKNIEKYILLGMVALFAIFVLPNFSSPYIVPKGIFGAIAISLALILWSVRSIIKKETTFSTGKFDLGVILLLLVYVISSIVKTPNKMEAFFFPGTTTFVVISVLFYFLVNQFDKKTKTLVLKVLFGSGILLSVSILFTQLGLFAKIPQLPAFMKDAAFNPVGGALPAAIFLATILTIGIALVIKESQLVKKVFWGVASTVIVFGLTIMVISLLPGKPQALVLPGLKTSWEILIDTLKISPIWGVGPDNYISAFNAFRSIAYNQTSLWLVRFSTASNFYFTLISETGFAGLAAISVLLIGIYRFVANEFRQKNLEIIPLAVLVLIFVFFPSAPALTFLLMALLAVFSKSEDKTVSLATTRVPSVIIATPIFLGIIALAIFGTKAVMAEATYKKSLTALSKNDAKGTYDLMIKAVNQNSRVDRYHASLAQVEMAIATSIANNKDLTEADRTNITQLISQAISEGKATVTLNPGRSSNWELLAQIYSNIMPFAQGADEFAIQTYTQAVALDPINPNLRISLGGVYYALGRYDEAIDAFKLAVVAKSDLANAHYNLAVAYKEKKNFDAAITEIKTVMSLVTKDSSDYNLAKTTLEALEKSKATVSATSDAQNLTTPQKQTSTITPPLELPTDAIPPVTQ